MQLKPNYIEFQKEIRKRKIEYLIHFTITRNLYGIFTQQEIMSRARLSQINTDQIDIFDLIDFPDKKRFDDTNYINLSISSPNTYLLNKFKERTKEDCTITWCILKINPKHIYDKETLFSVVNAASNAAKHQYHITEDINKFRMLFADELLFRTSSGERSVKRNGILSKYPTDIQAEGLVKDSIPLNSIIEVSFFSKEDLASTKAALSEFNTNNFVVDKEIFNPNRLKN